MSSDITREELWSWLSRHVDVAIVEALGPDFYASGHLPGAYNIPAAAVDAVARTALPDLRRTVVVYGSSGAGQAIEVAERLVSLGYEDVRVYVGGKEDWAEAGLPLDYGDPPPRSRARS